MSSLSLRARAAASALALSALIGGLVVLPATSASAAPTVDAQNTGGSVFNAYWSGPTHLWGQTFTATRGGYLTSVAFEGSGTGIGVQLRDTEPSMSNGVTASPGRTLGPTVFATADSTSTSGGWITATFSTPFQVTAGTTYSFSIPNGTSIVATHEAYAGGNFAYRATGNTWAYSGQYDTRFATHIDSPPPTLSGHAAIIDRGAAIESVDLGASSGAAVSIASGSLPPGIQLVDDVLSGTPTRSGAYSASLLAERWGSTAQSTVAITVTGAPTEAAITSATGTDGGIDVAWTAPADAGYPGALDFLVQWRAAGTEAWTGSATTTATSYPVRNLGNGVDWDVQVTPRSNGAGPASLREDVSPLVAPTAVTSLASAESDGALTVTWGAPESTGGAPVTSEASIGGGAWAAATSPLVIDAENGTPVTVEVRARNRSYEGPTASTGGTPRTLPDAATGLVATPGTGSVELAWTADGFDGGSPVTGWLVEHREVGDVVWIDSEQASGTARSATVSGLEDGTAYDFRVIPVNEAGEGAESPVATATPFRAADAAELTLDARGDRSLDVSWTAGFDGGRDVDAWRVELRAIGDEAWAQHGDLLAGDASSATIDGLAVGADVEVRVTAITEAGDGAASEPVSTRVLGLATAATAIRTSAQDGAIDVSWAAPESDGGSPVTHYLVGSSQLGSRSGDEIEVVGTSARLAGLANGSTFAVVVTPVTEAGRGEATRVEATPFAFAPVVLDASGRAVADAVRGQQLTIRAEGLPEGTVSIELHSTPVALGTATVGADGVLKAQVAIPADAELGRHDLVLALASEVAEIRTAAIPLQVSSAPVAATPAAQALASTGSEALPFALGGLLLLLGGALVRRRAGIRSAARG